MFQVNPHWFKSTAPTDFSAQYFYGCLLADNEDYANALPPLREAYRLNADCEPLLVLLARCCIEQNLPEGVKYLQILRKYPDMQAGPNSIALANNLGCLLTNTGNYDRATNAFNEAWAKDPQDFVPPQNLAVLYDQYRKDPRKALSYYRASEKAALAAGNTVKVDSYKTRIAALERENPHTPPAVKPHGTTAPKTGAKTTPKAGTTGKTTSSKTGAKTTSKTGTTSKPTAKKTTSTTLAH
jgi:tetratricopeptide (TPR) repeat protein